MKHTVITIGPIHKTIHQVKSAKAIWAASYMFSYLIKQLIIKAGVTSDDVILPYFKHEDLKNSFKVGLFPDRVLFKKEIPGIDKLIKEVITDFAKKVKEDLKEFGDNSYLESFLLDYIHFHHLNIEPSEENVIFELNKYLDTAELKNRIVINANEDVLYKFFENLYYNFLIREEFDKKEQRFPSTIEIAMGEFAKKDSVLFEKSTRELFKKERGEDAADNQHKFIDKIYSNENFNIFKRNYQKYVAVVQADGDNIGGFINDLYTQTNKDILIEEFSKKLFEFAKDSINLIQDYNGTPIYAGGDDLLFICPVAHSMIDESSNTSGNDNKKRQIKVQKSVMTLVDEIDVIFKQKFTDNSLFKDIIAKAKKKPSMSYGISISYYKFPLNQALEQGVNQLFYKAKKTCEKDAVSYGILKHSGQFIGALFHKNLNSYCLFSKLLTTKVNDENYVKSITYKLEPQEAVFYGIALESDVEKRNKKFDNFFTNNFNESEHTIWVNGEKKLITFLEKTKEFIKEIYSENLIEKQLDDEKKKALNKQNLNKVYAALRFVDFINNKEER